MRFLPWIFLALAALVLASTWRAYREHQLSRQRFGYTDLHAEGSLSGLWLTGSLLAAVGVGFLLESGWIWIPVLIGLYLLRTPVVWSAGLLLPAPDGDRPDEASSDGGL